MTPIGHTGLRRTALVALLATPLALLGWIGAGIAVGAGSTQPSMQVLPSTTGLKYSQTVDVKGHHLPKGSGSVAATICGLQDAAGKTIAKPGANDCAGAAEIGKLVVVKSWQSDGEFDTPYTLPKSGETFGKNARFCDKTHHCAIVVADANPNSPAYFVETVIQFGDQQPFGSSATPTTQPKTTTSQPKTAKKQPTTATPQPKTRTTEPASKPVEEKKHSDSDHTSSEPKRDKSDETSTTEVHGSVSGGAGGSTGSGSFTITIPPSGATTAPTLPRQVTQGLDQICGQLANAVKQGGGDPSALLAACGAIESGSGPQQLSLVLQSPSLLCAEGASAWQNNPQITAACNQAATALAPITSQIGNALSPVLPML